MIMLHCVSHGQKDDCEAIFPGPILLAKVGFLDTEWILTAFQLCAIDTQVIKLQTSSAVGPHEFKRYLLISLSAKGSEVVDHLTVLRLYSQGSSPLAKFQRGGRINYIDEAINLIRKALRLCPPGYPTRLELLDLLARCLIERCQQLGGIENLDETNVITREALELCPPAHPSRPDSLNLLAASLHSVQTARDDREPERSHCPQS